LRRPDNVHGDYLNHLWFAKRSDRPDFYTITSGSYSGGIAFLYRDPYGNIVGAQSTSEVVAGRRLQGKPLGDRQAKYKVWSHGDKIAYQLDTGEAPLHCFVPRDRTNLQPVIRLVEGGPKATATGIVTGNIVIGGNGGRFGSETLRRYLDDITANYFGGVRPLVLADPDQDGKQAPAMWKAYRVAETSGYGVQFEVWNSKYNGPDDAIKAGADLEQLHPLEYRYSLPGDAKKQIDKHDRGGETKSLRPLKKHSIFQANTGSGKAFEYPSDQDGDCSNQHQAWSDTLQNNRVVLVATATGGGKSWAAAKLPLALDRFGVEGVVMLHSDYRNADPAQFGDPITGEPLHPLLPDAVHWAKLHGRHGDLTRDDTGDLRTRNHGEPVEVKANCALHKEHATGRKLNRTYSKELCGGCPHWSCNAKQTTGEFTYKAVRAAAAKQPAILGDVLTVTVDDVRGKLLVIDEAGIVARCNKVEIAGRDLTDLRQYLNKRTIDGPITVEDCKAIVALLAKLEQLTTDPLGRQYGLNSGEAYAILAPLAADISPDTVKRIADTEPDTAILDTRQPAAQKRATLERAVKNWLPDFIRILQNKQPGGLTVARDLLTLTLPPQHLRELVAAAAKVLLLDATGNAEKLQKLLALKEAPAVVRQGGIGQKPIVTQIVGVGKLTAGQPRTPVQKEAITDIKRVLAKQHGAAPVSYEYQRHADEFDKYHFVHDRGRNDVEGKELVIVTGPPQRNLGGYVAEYTAITGRRPDSKQIVQRHGLGNLSNGDVMTYGCLTFADPDLAAYVARDIADNVIQLCGRQRANRHTDSPKFIYFITDYRLGIDGISVANLLEITGKPKKTSDPTAATAAKVAGSKSTPAKLEATYQRLLANHKPINGKALATAAGLSRRNEAYAFLKVKGCTDRTSLYTKRDPVCTPIYFDENTTETIQEGDTVHVKALAIPGDRLRTAAAASGIDINELYEIAGRHLPGGDATPEEIADADQATAELVTIDLHAPETDIGAAYTPSNIPVYPFPWGTVELQPIGSDLHPAAMLAYRQRYLPALRDVPEIERMHQAILLSVDNTLPQNVRKTSAYKADRTRDRYTVVN